MKKNLEILQPISELIRTFVAVLDMIHYQL